LDGPLPGGRAPPAAQDDLHAVLRPQRDARDPLPQVRESGTPSKSEGSAEGIGRRGRVGNLTTASEISRMSGERRAATTGSRVERSRTANEQVSEACRSDPRI